MQTLKKKIKKKTKEERDEFRDRFDVYGHYKINAYKRSKQKKRINKYKKIFK